MMRPDGAPFGQIGFQWPPRWRATGGEGRDVGDIWVGLGAHLPWLGTFEAQEMCVKPLARLLMDYIGIA